MKIKIIACGKFKSSQEYRQIFDYYKKRINLDLKLIELTWREELPLAIIIKSASALLFFISKDWISKALRFSKSFNILSNNSFTFLLLTIN